jgi:hypothetical protein
MRIFQFGSEGLNSGVYRDCHGSPDAKGTPVYMSSNEAAFVSCSVSDLGMPDNIEKCIFFYESSHGNDSQFSA